MKAWRSAVWVSAALSAVGFFCCGAGPPRSLAAAPLTSRAVDPARAAREVFQDPDFWWKRIDSRTISTSWLERLLAAIAEHVGRILAKIVEFLWNILRNLFRLLGGASSAGSIAVWGLVAALLVWSIWRIAPVVIRWLSGGAFTPRAPEGIVSQPLPEAADLYEQAGHALRKGAYAEAIRLALLALIAQLEKQGLLRYDTTRTNREYQIELGPSADLAACFGQLARIYERAWYGRIAPGPAEAERAISLCGSVIKREDLAPE